MVNKTLFRTKNKKTVAKTPEVTTNPAGGLAYRSKDRHALATYCCTGTFGGTYYVGAGEHLNEVRDLAERVDPDFLVKCAIYGRRQGFMKDMPAFLMAVLSRRDPGRFRQTFARVIDNAKMLSTFVQIIRSGQAGRKSLGSSVSKAIRGWLADRSPEQLFRDSVGYSPSLADVIRLAHPSAKKDPVEPKTREATYRYLLGAEYERGDLPVLISHYLDFKGHEATEVPDVPWQLLTDLDLTRDQWRGVFLRAGWHFCRMNLNQAERRELFSPGVGQDERVKTKRFIGAMAEKLGDQEAIRRSRVFPYQIQVALRHASTMPAEIRQALESALERSVLNVPAITGRLYVFPDVSGSMGAAVTGVRQGNTSVVTCREVAGLMCASLLRRNEQAIVWPWSDRLHDCPVDPAMTIPQMIALVSCGGGGTEMVLPFHRLLDQDHVPDVVVVLSDNMSWIDFREARSKINGTSTMDAWSKLLDRNPRAKLILVDLAATTASQVVPGPSILQVGGFGDHVFRVMETFCTHGPAENLWTDLIESVRIEDLTPAGQALVSSPEGLESE